jgi:5-methylcytosine-specific restriction endonuclease McrA
MKNHIKVYFKHFDYAVPSEVMCERCGSLAVDIHHIQGRGNDKDIIDNLMALCRKCHTLAHESISKKDMQIVHDKFMLEN